ncbi:hypothetical protein CEXT_487391 [Caerostris extrusa]|uniref:Uncharacterized protein n=1 Tax=Caerostris extrusa TaxID=172846 RepID=A0AAV4X3G9_CAEEX|nr:hypothetical protein CEXT_487391 [Caerostris extrusa]
MSEKVFPKDAVIKSLRIIRMKRNEEEEMQLHPSDPLPRDRRACAFAQRREKEPVAPPRSQCFLRLLQRQVVRAPRAPIPRLMR